MKDSTSRFNLHPQPIARPGECFICKSVNYGPFIDTGVDVPFEGVFYICSRCIKEMHGLLPVEPTEPEPETDRYNEGYSAGHAAAWRSLKETFNAAIGNSGPSAGHDIPALPLSGLPLVAPVDGAPEADSGARSDDQGESGTSDEPDEPNSGEGSDGVSDDSGLPRLNF